MGVIPRIAVHVFKDSVRDKVLYNLVIFAVLFISASYLIGQLTAGQDVKIIKDLGLSATNVFGLFIAVFIGIGLVAKEVERRSIYTILSKPVRRHEVILGKYSGLVLTLAVNLAVMMIAVYTVLAYISWTETEAFKRGWEAPATDPAMLTAFFLIFVQLALVTAIALFFSTFSSPILSAVLTFGLYVAGHFNADLSDFQEVIDSPVAAAVAKGLYYVLPKPRPVQRHGRGGARAAGDCRLRCAHHRIRGGVHRRAAPRLNVHLRQAGLQVTSSPVPVDGGRVARASWWTRPVTFGLVICLLVGVIVTLQIIRDDRYQVAREQVAALYILSGNVLGRMALSFDALLADVYWMRAVNHYGSTKISEDENKSYDLLYPLLDMTTTLDPRFNVAYRFGSIFLAEAFPNGPGRPDQAVALLQKGIPQRSHEVGVCHGHRLHLLLVATGLPGSGSLVRTGE